MKKVLLIVLILSGLSIAQDKKDYSPKFNGYVRAWHQTDFATNQGQYLIKQIRIGVSGSVNEYAGYRFLVDFAGLGKLTTTSTTAGGANVLTNATANFSEVLRDAAAIFTPVKNLTITAGQFKVPFSTDNLRSSTTIAFANRPLLTNVSPSIRDIGVMVNYKITGDVTADFSAGSFNGSGYNKTENDRSMDYSLRAVVSPAKNLNLSGNYYGGQALGADLNYFNFGADYKFNSLFVAAEFGNKNTKTPVTDLSGTSIFGYATYNIPLEGGFLKELIPAFRFEQFDPNTSADNNEVCVMTFGLTFEFAKITFAHFRINYEKYDYKDGRVNPDKLIFEIQTKF